MLPNETKKYLFDIAEACDLIAQFTQDKTLADDQRDPLLRSGVGGGVPLYAKSKKSISVHRS